MYRIVQKRRLHETVTLMEIQAPAVARKALPGQFIILRIDEEGERIPLTIADFDRERGTITIIYQKVGATTMRLDELEEGDLFFLHILGETLCYRVGDIRTILPEETDRLTIRTGEDLVTLITCTPYGINTHRLCVEGYRIPYTEEVKEEAQSQADSFRIQIFLQDYGWIFVTLLLLVTLGIMLWRYNKKK